METHSSILAWRIPWTEEPEWATIHGATKNQTRLEQQHTCISKKEDIVFQLPSLDYNLPWDVPYRVTLTVCVHLSKLENAFLSQLTKIRKKLGCSELEPFQPWTKSGPFPSSKPCRAWVSVSTPVKAKDPVNVGPWSVLFQKEIQRPRGSQLQWRVMCRLGYWNFGIICLQVLSEGRSERGARKWAWKQSSQH